MKILPDWLKNGYVKLMDPIAVWMVRHRVHPNTITVWGTIFYVAGGVLYGTGHIMTGGWLLSVTALTDVLDGMVARRSNLSSDFGAFLDSSLDRVADGAVLGGLAFFYALNPVHQNVWMFVICLVSIVGAFMTSYTRARAEAIGLDAKVGMMQRPERVVLLSAPQALFGVARDGWVLAAIVILLTVTAWYTVFQRVGYVYERTRPPRSESADEEEATEFSLWDRRPSRETAARPAALKGE